MADSTYVALRDESSLSWFEMTQCQDTQSPQQTPRVPDPKLNPNGQFQGNGRGRGGGSRGRGGQRNNRYNAHVQNTNVSGNSNGNVQKSKYKCTICEGKHNNLIFCKELSKYLPCESNKKHFLLQYVLSVWALSFL